MKPIKKPDLQRYFKKQSSRGILQKKCSSKFRKIQKKTPVPVSFLIKLQALDPGTGVFL